MNESRGNSQSRVYDRELLLYGSKRNEVLSLAEVEQYGLESFGNGDYVSIYGMAPREWYRHGVRLLGRTAVECTRDALGDRIGRERGEGSSRSAQNYSPDCLQKQRLGVDFTKWARRHTGKDKHPK